MPRQGRFSTLVGVATIVGTIFAGIAVKTELVFAVNTAVDVVKDVKDQSQLALGDNENGDGLLKRIVFGHTEEMASTRDGLASIDASDAAPTGALPLPKLSEQVRKPVAKRKRTVKRRNRRQRATKVTRRTPKRKTVNIFAAAKDIPMPSQD